MAIAVCARKLLISMAMLMIAAGCTEEHGTQPRFRAPEGIIVGLDPTKRLPPKGEFGGNAAMQEISNQLGETLPDSPDPLIRAVAEWRSRQGNIRGSRASMLSEGVEQYDGDYYVWSGGESFAPAHKASKIYDFVAQASRVPDGPIDFKVTFKFDGHAASNEASWTIARSTGEVLVSRPRGSFGSMTEPALGLTMFARRGWAAASSDQIKGCDAVVTGDSRGKAWYEGVWDANGLSVGINPAGPGIQTTMTRRRSGETEASGSLNTAFTCGYDPASGGGGGGYGGGDECTVCQQWFLPVSERWTFMWWECELASPTECQAPQI